MNRFGYGPIRLGKPVFYNKTYTLKSLRTLGLAYKDYPKIRGFLGKFGLHMDTPEVGIKKGLAAQGYMGYHLPGISYIDPILGKTDTVIHEIIHEIQEPAEPGKLSSYSIHMDKTLGEAGAELVTILYKLDKQGNADNTPLLLTNALLKNFSARRQFESKLPSGRRAMMEEIGGAYSALHTGFGMQPEPVEKRFSEYTNPGAFKDVDRTKSITFAMLVLACNDFDVNETVKDLVEPERLEKIISKVSAIADSDFDGTVLARIKMALYR